MNMTNNGSRSGAAALCVLISLATACNGDDAVPSDDTDGTSTGTADGPTNPTTMDTTSDPSTGSVDTTAGDDDDDDDDDDDTTTTDTGGDPPEVPDVPGETITCDNEIAAAPAGQVCDVTPGSSTLLIQGTVLAGWDVYEAGTVLVDTSEPNGRILCTGCDCADEPEAAGATVISCADGVVSPGLINAHDHITFTLSQPVPHATERYDHRHEWRLGLDGATELDTFPGSDSSRSGVLFGEVRMLLGGATSLTGSVGGASAQDLVRNLDRGDVTGGLQGVDVNYRTFPLGDSDGTMLTMSCGYPFIDGPFNLGDDIYMPHVSEGIGAAAQNEFECMSGGSGGEELIASNTSIVHGIGVTAQDIDEMREVGAMLVWSPRSNVDLYGVTADLPLYRSLGVRIALGTDWTASGSMNVLRELQCADSYNADHLSGFLADSELWMMATHWGAASQGAADQLGLLAPGYIGDITIFDGSRVGAHRAVIEADVSDVALVLRGGQPLHGDAPIIEALVPGGEIDGCEPLDVCGSDKRLCLQRDAGLNLATLTAGVHPESYDLFFCDEPDLEPSCDPARPDEFPLRGGPDDLDGDGVEDDEDNCPDHFNPIRPLDDGIQADTDQDGIGDTCDLCPLDGDDTCTVPNVYDQDGDGVADPDDNCILDDNPDQEDTDEDGQGDACDLCPTVENPGGSPCPTTIYEIKDGTIDFGSNVFVPNALVTGIGDTGYFLQVHPDDSGYEGVDYSGVFVYDPGLPMTLAVGDYVSITGQVQDFFGQTQLVASNDPIVLSSGNPAPPAEPTTVADIIEGGADQEALEGVVVELQNLTVSDVMPMAGPGDDGAGEFEVEGGLRINDYFYLADPFPMVDQQYARVRGVVRWANAFSKLEPRGLVDYPPSMVAFGSPDSFLLEGSTAEPLPGLEVELSSSVDADTTISLTYANPAIVTGPASVDVLMGTASIPVQLTGVSLGTADVTAELDGVMLTTSVRVYNDAEPRVPTLSPATGNVTLGNNLTMTVDLDIPAPAGGQTVDLAVTPGTCLTGPATVSVAAAELTAQFDVTALGCTGDEDVTASIGPAMSTATISVVDTPVFPNVIIAEVYYDHSGGDNNFEWVKLYNGTGAPVDLSGYSLGWGGTDYTYGGLDLVGTIAAGECFVVGGPMGDADNGFPAGGMFDQAANLEPDMQNSGATADGVALFDIPVASVLGGSVPLDAVIYGDDNASGLLDESGAAGTVDVADAPSTDSVQLLSDGSWAINPDPTPLACAPFPDP